MWRKACWTSLLTWMRCVRSCFAPVSIPTSFRCGGAHAAEVLFFLPRMGVVVSGPLTPMVLHWGVQVLEASRAWTPHQAATAREELLGAFPNTYTLTKVGRVLCCPRLAVLRISLMRLSCLLEIPCRNVAGHVVVAAPLWPFIPFVPRQAMAERLVATRAAKQGTPVTIVRPSIVGCSWRFPAPGWVDTVNAFGTVTLSIALGLVSILPIRADAVADLVPVDHVAHLILAAAFVYAKTEPVQVRLLSIVFKLQWNHAKRVARVPTHRCNAFVSCDLTPVPSLSRVSRLYTPAAAPARMQPRGKPRCVAACCTFCSTARQSCWQKERISPRTCPGDWRGHLRVCSLWGKCGARLCGTVGNPTHVSLPACVVHQI